MGTWGAGPFDNDEAADWSADIAEADDPSAVAGADLDAVVNEEGYVDVDLSQRAIAAAAWVAAALPGGPPLPPHYAPTTSWGPPESGLRTRAAAGLAAATAPTTEWSELWDEAGELAQAYAALDAIRERLSRAD